MELRDINRESDVENPVVARDSTGFPMLVGHIENDDDEDIARIGRNSLADMGETLPHHRQPTKGNRKTVLDRFHYSRKKLIRALEYRDLKWYTKLFLLLLLLPTAVFCLIKQLRMFIVVGVFNYTGFNLRPYLYFYMATERDILRAEEKFQGGPLTLSKVMYLAQRYMTYWVVIVVLIIATPFINQVTIVDILEKYQVFQSNATLNYLFHVGISILIGFANIIPSKPIRSDITSFLSSFTEEDYTIRDGCHTRLKDLSEILRDIKKYGFLLLQNDIGSPIIISTKAPEELRIVTGFTALLSTDTFDNNQILRFIQIEEDVDSFFVLRNDIGMCHRVDFDPFQWNSFYNEFKDFKIRLEISELELNIYGGASLVMIACLFSATSKLPVSSILTAWVLIPLILAIIYRRRRSKLASINFFTLDGKDRKYQPYNNICVSTDDVIMKKIYDFKFFNALFKFTLQGRYLIHTLLKITEKVPYDWLETGLKLRDFKRLACMAATVYERDVGVITPNGRVFYSAPRKHNNMCVICTVNVNGEVTSQLMTRLQFNKATDTLPEGKDTPSVENMFIL